MIAVVLQLVDEVDVFIGIIGMFKGDVHLARQAGVAHKGLPDVASSNLLGIIGVDVGAAFPLDVVHFGGNKRVGAAAFQRYVRDIDVYKRQPYSFADDREGDIEKLKELLRMAEYATADNCMAELVKRLVRERMIWFC